MRRRLIARRLAVTFVLVAAAGLGRPAGVRGQQTAPPRTLGAGTATLSVDFLALDRNNRPVVDLKPEEITIRVDGKVRPIRSLMCVSAGAGSDPSSAPEGDPPPAPFATNDMADGGRSLVLMIDDETLRAGSEQPVRDAVGHLLSGLGERDRVAVITLPHGGLQVDFTDDHSRVRQALSQLSGRAVDKETATDATVRTRTTLQQITSWVDSLGGGQGPTTVVLFSSSLVGLRGQMAQASRARGSTANLGTDQLRQEEFEAVGDAVAAARVQFYIVEHDPVIAAGETTASTSAASVDLTSTRGGLENLAGATGGVLLSLAEANGETALTRVNRETSAYWAATIEAAANERNGANHALSIKVSRAGVTVRTRPVVPIARVDADSARPTPTSPHAMLVDARMYHELLLRVAGYASRNTADGQVKIVAVAETVDSGATFAAAELALFDDGGHMLKQWAPAPGDLGSNRLVGAFSGIPKGHYRLRLAATDAAGHRGTTDYDVSAELAPAGAMSLSDIALGVMTPERQFAPRLQFSAEPVTLAMLDLYGGRAGAKVTVMFEVARTLNGPAIVQIHPAVDATSEPDRFTVMAGIPLDRLPTGDYVIRAIVIPDGQPAGRVVRTLRKVAR